MRASDDYAALAEKALEDANHLFGEAKKEQLWIEAQVWAALAIAASNVEKG